MVPRLHVRMMVSWFVSGRKEDEKMSFELSNDVLQYLKDSEEETIKLIETLCGIPAPSHHEERRAAFVKDWLEANGAKGVYIDSALNVLYPVGCEGKDDIVVFVAHTDTVFPDMEPMPFRNDGEYLYAPGVGDDTTSLAVMMMIAKYVAKHDLKPSRGVLFVANSCEEGLGNLKGTKQLMADYKGRITEFYSFDAKIGGMTNKCVGSHRYEVLFETEGGHSFGAFGNRNAIYAMSDVVCRLYDCEVPVDGDSRTTYNVGIVEGGTSVNTIAQNCKILYEYRSDSAECLAKMQAFFEDTITKAKADGKADITVNLLGIRPCEKDVDAEKLAAMTEKSIRIIEKHSGKPCQAKSGSTDCNIPMSMGIPAVAVPVYWGDGTHTREERVQISSIPTGLKIGAEFILEYFEK